jgi:uncharacterized FlaG/YvyC family protein
MGAQINKKKILNEEPYQSIINLLNIYRDGLELKHIQYAIMKEPCLYWKTERTVKEKFGNDIDYIIKSGYIKQYEIKDINRTQKIRQRSQDPKHMEGKRIRNNLRNFLRKMMDPPNKVIDVLTPENDKRMIGELENIKIKRYANGRINIYGLQDLGEDYYDTNDNEMKRQIPEETQLKLDKAVEKLSEGINDLQKIFDHSIGWSISKDKSLTYLKDEKYPLLDRQLLSIYKSSLFKSLNYIIKPKVEDWFPYKSTKPLVVYPDNELVELVKNQFYLSKSTEKVRSMLDGHIICEEIKACFGNDHFLKMHKMIGSHIIAVVHSNTGTIIQEDLKKNIAEIFPLSSEIKDKFHIGLLNNPSEFLNNYIETDDKELQEIIEKSGIKKKIDANQSLDFNDLIVLHKHLMR